MEPCKSYVPPHKRQGFVANSLAPETNYTADGIFDVFKTRGWVRGAGGDLYSNGNRTTDHPHLRLKLDTGEKIALNGDVRKAVKMLAWSDGRQGQGGGGRTMVSDGVLYRNAQETIGRCNMNAEMASECTFLFGGLK